MALKFRRKVAAAAVAATGARFTCTTGAAQTAAVWRACVSARRWWTCGWRGT